MSTNSPQVIAVIDALIESAMFMKERQLHIDVQMEELARLFNATPTRVAIEFVKLWNAGYTREDITEQISNKWTVDLTKL